MGPIWGPPVGPRCMLVWTLLSGTSTHIEYLKLCSHDGEFNGKRYIPILPVKYVFQILYLTHIRNQSMQSITLSITSPLWLESTGHAWFPSQRARHSVESPSTVDPQWDIWYWGSKWNLHTVCWSVVGCEWGTTSVYFGITYVCFIPSRLPVFAVEPQYLPQDFLFLSKVSFEGHIQNLQKISCWFMGFLGPKLIKLWTSSIWGFL